MTVQTTFAKSNPWAQLLALQTKESLPRRRYYFQDLKPGKKLYMEQKRVRSAAKALRQYVKRHNMPYQVRETLLGRPCIWMEVLN